MAKERLKNLYKDVLESMTYNYLSILEVSQKSKVSWEACKNCLEVLEYIGFIKSDNNKNIRYKKKHLLDLDKVGGLL